MKPLFFFIHANVWEIGDFQTTNIEIGRLHIIYFI